MRIVFVLDHAHVNGGLAKVAIDEAIGLRRRGHDVGLFAAVGPVAPTLEAAGVDVTCLGQPALVDDPNQVNAMLRGLWNRSAAEALGALLADAPRGDTLIHLHGFAKALSTAISLPIARSGHAALFTAHDFYLVCPNGGFYNYRRDAACSLKPLSAACLLSQCDTRAYPVKLWRAARTALGKVVHRLPRTLTDVAYFHDFQRRIIEPHLPAGTRLHELPNPVDTVDLGPKADAAVGDAIFVGRLSREKGCDLFAEAARRAGIRPRFVGDGPMRPELAARFPDARFDGWRDAQGVRTALRAARVMVFPSRLYEGQPLTVLESLSLGTPVITGDGTAGRESVADGETGLWFRQGDVADLAVKLNLSKDDGLIARLSKAAHAAYWAAPATLDRHLDRLEAIYDSLMRRGGRAA